MKTKILLIIAVAILLGVCQVQAVEYEVVILGTLGGTRSYAYAINDSGQVVGQSYTSDSQLRAFLWDKDNGMQNLGVLEFPGHSEEPRYSYATGINNSGQVVGYSCYHDGPEHAFLWENGQIHDIHSPKWKRSHATAINNLGQIVGYSTDISDDWYEDTHAILWDHGIVTDLGAIQGGRSYAFGNNDHSQVVGKFYKPSNRHYNGCTWANGVFTDLGEIDEYGSFAGDINNSGVIVGHVTFRREGGGIVSQAMIWENYQMINLGYLEYPESFATAINDSGQIVGYSRVIRGPSSHFHACLWQNGEIIDLTRFFPEEVPTHAYDINASGQIVGYVEIGGTYRAFLMTPIPEPTTRLVPDEYTTIQAAIDAAYDGDTVLVADGVYTGDGNRDIDFLGKAITVRSENGPENCIIDCNGTEAESHRGFYFRSGEDTNSIVDGLIITNGYVTLGGGIYCRDSSPMIKNCVIKGNAARNCGGGIYNEEGHLTMTNCVFSKNLCRNKGGGIYNQCGNLTVINCSFNNNSAGNMGWGGGLRNFHGTANILNSIFAGNWAGLYGGGVENYDSNMFLANCTFSGNYSNVGGGICSWYGGSLVLTNCILWYDEASEGLEIYVDSTRTVKTSYASVSYTNIQGGQDGVYADPTSVLNLGLGNIQNNPLFVDTANSDYHLLEDSPCINAGDPNYVAGPNETDIDGQPRVWDGRVDMGADEFVPMIEATMKFTPQALNPGSKGKWVKAHFVLPEGFGVEDVDTDTPIIIEPLGIESEYINVFFNEDGLVEIEAGFGRAAFCSAATDCGPIEVTVVGKLVSGQNFYGTDTIKIINDSFRYLAVLTSRWLEVGCGAPDWCGGLDLNQDSAINFVDFAMFDGCCIEIVTQ